MKRRLRKAKLIGVIIGLLELFGVLFLGITYYFGWFNFKEIITPVILFISLGTAVIIDIVYVWGVLFYFSKIRQ